MQFTLSQVLNIIIFLYYVITAIAQWPFEYLINFIVVGFFFQRTMYCLLAEKETLSLWLRSNRIFNFLVCECECVCMCVFVSCNFLFVSFDFMTRTISEIKLKREERKWGNKKNSKYLQIKSNKMSYTQFKL